MIDRNHRHPSIVCGVLLGFVYFILALGLAGYPIGRDVLWFYCYSDVNGWAKLCDLGCDVDRSRAMSIPVLFGSPIWVLLSVARFEGASGQGIDRNTMIMPQLRVSSLPSNPAPQHHRQYRPNRNAQTLDGVSCLTSTNIPRPKIGVRTTVVASS